MYNGGTYGGYGGYKSGGYKSDYKSGGYKSSRTYGEYGNPKGDIYTRPLRYDATTNYYSKPNPYATYSKPNPYATYERPPEPQYVPQRQSHSSPHGHRGRAPRGPSQPNPLCDTRIIAIIVGTVLFMACIGIIIWVAIPDSKREETISVIVATQISLTTLPFDARFNNLTDEFSIEKAKEVCDLLIATSGATDCIVLKFTNGSTIVDAELEKKIPVSQNTANIENATTTEFESKINKGIQDAQSGTLLAGATVQMIVGTTKTVCPAGQTGSDSCSSCPVKTYKAQAGAGSCTSCPPGQTTNGMGATAASACLCDVGKTGPSCSDCPVDTYKDEIGAGSCTACPTNKTTNGMTGATNASACVEMPAPPDMTTMSSDAINPSPTASDDNAGGNNTMDMMSSGGMMDMMSSGGMMDMMSSGGMMDMSSEDMLNMSSGDMISMNSGDMMTMNSGDMMTMSSGDMMTMSSGGMMTMSSGDMMTMNSVDMMSDNSTMAEDGGSSSMDEDENSSSMDEDGGSSSMDEDGGSSSMDEDENSSSMGEDDGSSSMAEDDDSSSSMDMENNTTTDEIDATATEEMENSSSEDDMMSSTAA